MTVGKRVGIWLIALLAGVGLANAAYWIVWFGVGSVVCGDGCEDSPLAIGLLAGAAALTMLILSPVLLLRGARRWSNDT
jgi:hypothetical protein